MELHLLDGLSDIRLRVHFSAGADLRAERIRAEAGRSMMNIL